MESDESSGFSFRNPFKSKNLPPNPPEETFRYTYRDFDPMAGVSIDFSKVKYLKSSRYDGPTRPPFVDPPRRSPKQEDIPRGPPRDKITATDHLWHLYRTNKQQFVELLLIMDGPSWPKYMLTPLGQSFRIDEDGFVWNLSG